MMSQEWAFIVCERKKCKLLPALAAAAVPYTDCQQGEGSLHDFTLKTLDGSQDVALSDYQGKVVLVINVATY